MSTITFEFGSTIVNAQNQEFPHANFKSSENPANFETPQDHDEHLAEVLQKLGLEEMIARLTQRKTDIMKNLVVLRDELSKLVYLKKVAQLCLEPLINETIMTLKKSIEIAFQMIGETELDLVKVSSPGSSVFWNQSTADNPSKDVKCPELIFINKALISFRDCLSCPSNDEHTKLKETISILEGALKTRIKLLEAHGCTYAI